MPYSPPVPSNSWVRMFYTRGALKKHGSIKAAMRAVPLAAAHVLAQRIKRRAMGRGDIAGQDPGRYASGSGARNRYIDRSGSRTGVWRTGFPKGSVAIPDGYDAKSPGSPFFENEERGLTVYQSSAEFHRGTKRGTFNVSDGMWGGLTVVGGVRDATVAFRYRSTGQTLRLKRYKRKRSRFKAYKVSNALKAGTVLNVKGVNLLALKHSELDSISSAVSWHAATNAIESRLGIKVKWSKRPPMSSLAQSLMRNL